jgi:peptidoglycan hydrolase-like protein with peptidoglycan-binding domain
MRHSRLALIGFLGLALAVAGCGKKAEDQANLAGTGFDSLAGTEDLAQLPQTSANQQSAVEVLPVEAAPVTQSLPVPTDLSAVSAPALDAASAEALSYQQKIQTALKNAGFYTGAIDGKIGPASRRAIEAFQQQNGLKVDGKVGPKTWAALDSDIRCVVPNDIPGLLKKHPGIHTIFLNGRLAEALYKKHFAATLHVAAHTLPSTSPANASIPYAEKKRRWSVILKYLGNRNPWC